MNPCRQPKAHRLEQINFRRGVIHRLPCGRLKFGVVGKERTCLIPRIALHTNSIHVLQKIEKPRRASDAENVLTLGSVKKNRCRKSSGIIWLVIPELEALRGRYV